MIILKHFLSSLPTYVSAALHGCSRSVTCTMPAVCVLVLSLCLTRRSMIFMNPRLASVFGCGRDMNEAG